MAPKKKAKFEADARFASLKVVVIDALPFQKKIWGAKVGGGFVAVTSSEVRKGALAQQRDATHVVSCVKEGGDDLVAKVLEDVGEGPFVVLERWLTASLGAGGGLAAERDYQRGTTGVVFCPNRGLEFTENRSCRSW